jgi:MFS family permease
LAWVVFTQVASGLSGSTVAASYQGIMFGIVGFTGRTTLLVSALYGFMGPAASLINILFIADKWGRRTTMWVGYASLTVCLSVIMLLCGLFATNIGNTYQESVAAVAFFFLFSGCISFSLENTPAVICTELLPYLLRGVGFGMGYFASSCVQIMINQVSPIIFNQISYKYYAVYIFCDIVSTFVYFFLFKETKGKTLEEIGALFGEEVATKNINEISLDELEVGKNETEHKELV